MKRIKYLSFFCIAAFASTVLFAQKPVKEIRADALSEAEVEVLQKEFGKNKIIPVQYKKQIITALTFFPELKDVAIEFKVKQTCKAPLTTTPTVTSILKPQNKRKFVITIRNLQSKNFQPILFENLPYNTQVGVIGHELSHVIDFSRKNSFGLIANGIQQVSYRYVDRFEYQTDSICVAHGLGYQLLDWSIYVRRSLHRNNWIGTGNADEQTTTRERYMNPSTIERKILTEAIYMNKP
ncbi:MAG: hypothetical protein ICV53_22395 [Flavisolibacter sp.]|nr:hypothetical protein [Flavisolibacter sp.]MBD0368845.1 hypothetical protein [Flavisolibacter sp.]